MCLPPPTFQGIFSPLQRGKLPTEIIRIISVEYIFFLTVRETPGIHMKISCYFHASRVANQLASLSNRIVRNLIYIARDIVLILRGRGNKYFRQGRRISIIDKKN